MVLLTGTSTRKLFTKVGLIARRKQVVVKVEANDCLIDLSRNPPQGKEIRHVGCTWTLRICQVQQRSIQHTVLSLRCS